jgi:hypothetical protein
MLWKQGKTHSEVIRKQDIMQQYMSWAHGHSELQIRDNFPFNYTAVWQTMQQDCVTTRPHDQS